jgi:hypothetical protein
MKGCYSKHWRSPCIFHRGVYSSIIIPPPPPWGGGKESKGLSAWEENQRRVEKMERQRLGQRENKRKISVGNSWKSVFHFPKWFFLIFSWFWSKFKALKFPSKFHFLQFSFILISFCQCLSMPPFASIGHSTPNILCHNSITIRHRPLRLM